MRIRNAAFLSFLAGTACEKAKEKPDYAECYVVDTPHNPKKGFAELTISDDSLLQASSRVEIDVLKGKFKNEAVKQAEIIKEAGGYCAVPETFEGSKDTRLGDKLGEVVKERNKFLVENFGAVGEFDWSVELKRAQCEVVEGVELRDDIEASDQEKKNLELNVGEAAKAWNRYCAEAQGGYWDKKYSEPMSAGMILTLRGWEINNSLDETSRSRLRSTWRKICTPNEDPEKTLDSEELEQFMASQVLAQAVLENSRWTCPAEVEVNNGFDLDNCGRLNKCVPTGEIDDIGKRGKFEHTDSLYINPNFLDD